MLMPRYFSPIILYDNQQAVQLDLPKARKEQIQTMMKENGQLWISMGQGDIDSVSSRSRSSSNNSTEASPLTDRQDASPPPILTDKSMVTPTATSILGSKRRGNLPKPVTCILKQWLMAHVDYPYPTESEKAKLQQQTHLTMCQISNWFINARRRIVPHLCPTPPCRDFVPCKLNLPDSRKLAQAMKRKKETRTAFE
ncbi:hypothetical protein DM01DRAFT_1306589 [Hesseltinella vesiculosa]|uniref:Homeobox domain-containing protein n=1 Tax=Hesseltinella vesiculosa TaxID=101127 RepID=A0A1X2GGZ6_9FUNG|nr:hypothetical protein DM01DRAFT_1306589 [Hesseltinella vesiculosa]